jgi:hypothetical protein
MTSAVPSKQKKHLSRGIPAKREAIVEALKKTGGKKAKPPIFWVSAG